MPSGKLQLFLPGCVLSLLIALGGAAAAASLPPLEGDYAFTGEGTCLVSPSGFNSDLTTPKGAKVFSDSFSTQGTRTFDGKGAGTVEGTGVSVTAPPTPGLPGLAFLPSAGSFSFKYQFTYKIASDGTISTQLVPKSYLQIFLTGPRKGQTATIDKLSASGLASKQDAALTLASETTIIETHKYSNGEIWPEICHRSSVLVVLP
jgi:hypothetical protein